MEKKLFGSHSFWNRLRGVCAYGLGLLFMFNRLTGEPLWGVEERPIPRLDAPGDQTWPTQPFPLHPTGLTRDSMTRSEVSKITPEDLQLVMISNRVLQWSPQHHA